MPFSKLADPIEVALARAALERAWAEIKGNTELLLASDETERLRLAGIVAGLAPLAIDEDDLVANAVAHFALSCRNHSHSLAS